MQQEVTLRLNIILLRMYVQYRAKGTNRIQKGPFGPTYSRLDIDRLHIWLMHCFSTWVVFNYKDKVGVKILFNYISNKSTKSDVVFLFHSQVF